MSQIKLFQSGITNSLDADGRRRELGNLERQMNAFLREIDRFGWKREDYRTGIENLEYGEIIFTGSIVYKECKSQD